MLPPIVLFVFVPGMQRAAWLDFCAFSCFDSLTSLLISHKDAIIDVIKRGVQQKRASSQSE